MLPTCAAGHFGAPELSDVTCETGGGAAELSLSGCTACTAVPNSDGEVTCTDATDSSVTGCAAGYTRTVTDCGPDTCEPNVCIARTTDVEGFAPGRPVVGEDAALLD